MDSLVDAHWWAHPIACDDTIIHLLNNPIKQGSIQVVKMKDLSGVGMIGWMDDGPY